MSNNPRAAFLLAFGVVTAASLALQVMLTRMFASVLAYHFSFLAISLSLLGTGAGALVVYLRPQSFADRDPEVVLGRWSVWFALSLVMLPLAVVNLDLVMPPALNARFIANLAAACVVAAIPPFAAGVVVAVAISRYVSSIGLVYAVDLIGAGLGAFLAVPVLWLGPAPNLLVGTAVLVAAAAWLMTGEAAIRRRALVSGALALILLAAASVTRVLYLDPGHGVRHGAPVAEHWTPLTRAFGYRPAAGGKFGLLLYDRVYAPVPLPQNGELPDWRILRTGPQSIGYSITGPGHALIIGGGGGRDIYTALAMQQTVDVIELNEGIRRVVDDDLGELSGRPYSRAGVSTVIGDGRSALAARDTLYDQIHLGFTDTFSANAAQGFALAENNLYTIEAFREYFAHLKPRGVLNVSRLYRLVGDEALRATVLMQAALESLGIERPREHMVVIRGTDFLGPPTGTVLARLEPFTAEELNLIRELAAERGDGVVYGPQGPYEDEWKRLAEAPSLWDFCASYHLDVCPPTDDRPFFFNMERPRSLGRRTGKYWESTSPFAMLLTTLAILLVLCLVAFVVPFWLVRESRRPPLASLWYFWLIGLGFLLVEISMIQRLVLFLGFPTYALSVVLFSLLIFSGAGSALTTAMVPRRALPIALGAAAALIVFSSFALPPLLASLMWLPLYARIAVSVAVVVPIALTLGMAMPLGLRRLQGLYPQALPYAWGVNGIASVLASVLGVAIAMLFGFTVAGIAAAACYAGALAHAQWGEWPAGNL